MFLLLWAAVVLHSLCSFPSVYCQDPEIEMTVPEIIRRWGYPVEVHNAVTQDGYILEMHRIPYGKAGPASNVTRPVIFLQHGLECSSSNWVMNLPEQSAGFLFADAGFDVWMGNMRGNKYSKSHAHLDSMSSDFWNFTWDSMAQYDLPAMIDQVLLVTGQDYVYYVGHSQGTLTMFAKLSTDIPFSKKIKIFFALAPILAAAHVKGVMKTLMTLAPPEVPDWTEMFGSHEFNTTSDLLTDSFIPNGCKNASQREICKEFLFLLGGPGSKTTNTSRIPVYYSHFPDGTSSLNMLHWVQMVQTGETTRLDRGTETNVAVYGQKSPPKYNFRDVPKIPIYLFSGGNDYIAVDDDIYGSLLPQIEPSVQKHTHLPEYNHFDFVFGLRATADVYKPIMNVIQNDLQ